jgi:hypothetical protein
MPGQIQWELATAARLRRWVRPCPTVYPPGQEPTPNWPMAWGTVACRRPKSRPTYRLQQGLLTLFRYVGRECRVLTRVSKALARRGCQTAAVVQATLRSECPKRRPPAGLGALPRPDDNTRQGAELRAKPKLHAASDKRQAPGIAS